MVRGLGFVLLMAAACAAEVDERPEADLVVGLGGKADEGGCDATSPLCWPSADAATMRAAFGAEDALLLPDGDAGAAAAALSRALDDLRFKVPEGARPALADLRTWARDMPADASDEERAAFVEHAHQLGFGELVSGYVTAHAVPIGVRAEGGKMDAAGTGTPATDDGLTPDMRASLDELRDAGIVGYTYAFAFEHFGVLDRTYAPFDEPFPFSEPAEQRVERIIRRHQWASAGASALAGAESLIPYAGIVISFSHDAIMQFRIRARMVFEIAEAYGFDLREGNNLAVAALVMMGAYELPELRAQVVATAAIPILTKLATRLTGAITVQTIVRDLIRRLLDRALSVLARQSGEALARAGARAAARSVGRQILGWATFGLALLADVALTTATTGKLGDHTATMLRPWGSAMLTEGASFMSDPADARCAGALLANVALADARLDSAERALLAAQIDRPVFVDDAYRPLTTYLSRSSHASAMAAGARVATQPTCVADRFVGADRAIRLALLSWARTVAAVDGEIHWAERAVYDTLVDTLRGERWFGDGDELEAPHLADIETTVDGLLTADLAATDVIDRLARPYPEAEAALAGAGL